ncbi:GtrA family protein [Rhodococcus sp. IEGM 1379]|uniref:GtrA family protein n=1 Tax=Rhodococcus sp. IEGM 1379 TaxID=3047086 RepID=UPI0024B70A51|nr:GtrA family protein [Rhodococcus sp. IEGM 1379]MDI9917187.1 GtrA family protein [Rhodococcus sp. IEGM 1379]
MSMSDIWVGSNPTSVVGRQKSGISARLIGLLTGDRAFVQLIRFALVGGISNILYFGVFLAVHSDGVLVANAIGAVLSTILANELHRRLTFHAADRVHWFTAQWEGGGLALIGLIASSAAISALGVLFPGSSGVLQAALVIGVSALVGGLRFVALRGWVF